MISNVCVILHNMIVKMSLQGNLNGENNAAEYASGGGLIDEFFLPPTTPAEQDYNTQSTNNAGQAAIGLASLLERDAVVTDPATHRQICAALTEHLWSKRGNQTT